MKQGDLEQIHRTVGFAHALLREGRANDAIATLEQLRQSFPKSAEIEMNLALAFKTSGNLLEALKHTNLALAADPYSFIARLSKGMLEERLGQRREAANTYGEALALAPDQESLNEGLREQVAHANTFKLEYSQEMEHHLRGKVRSTIELVPNSYRDRANEFIELAGGAKKHFVSQSVQLQYPCLPAISFYEKKEFPWIQSLEAKTDVIANELQAFLAQSAEHFEPYVQYPAGTPENQFADLNHDKAWSSVWLWKDGTPQNHILQKFPETSAILDGLPLFSLPGLGPTAVISSLSPGAKIPPHTGSTNVRLLAHLPLILNGKEFFRVGNYTRQWRLGEAWIFDDTIEHEAWNDGESHRYILILDIWNPYLCDEEQQLVRQLLKEKAIFEAIAPQSTR